jgi:hypothetical protein
MRRAFYNRAMLAPILAAVLIPLTSHHTPKAGPEQARTIPATHTGCDGLAALRALEYFVDISAHGNEVLVDVHGAAVVEKTKKGPLAAPLFFLKMTGKDGPQTYAVALDDAMASPSWEAGGTFRTEFRHEQLVDAKFWDSAELRCTAASPYRPPVVAEGIVYKNGDDMAAAAAAKAIVSNGLAALCDVTLVGPDLYPAIKDDPALKRVESPTMISQSGGGQTPRSMLRVKGEKECAALGEALRKYTGTLPPRVRAATARELALHWLNIGWDIEEPLLVLDYGAHRLIAEFQDGKLFMIDEVSSASPSPPPASRAAPGPGSR